MSALPDDRPLEEKLIDLYDPDGSLRRTLSGMGALTGNPVGRLLMRHLLKQDVGEWDARLADFQRIVASASEGIRQFTAQGWAPCDLTPASGVEKAVAALAVPGGMGAAEQALADAWNDGLLGGASCVNRVRTLGLPSEEYNAVFRERGRLLFKAWEHHRNGAYEASVPIVYAQVEGICYDVTGKPFFSRRDSAAQPVDSRTLAGMSEALPVARQWFSEGLDFTSTSPEHASRHGVLHGRSLRYDNRLASTKALVLLLAVVEWARPIAAELGKWFEADRTAAHVGSQETDSEGRRHDRRESAETTTALDYLSGCQQGWHRSRGEGYRPELLALVEDGFRGLPADHGVTMEVAADRRSWFAWRRTVTGLVFAIGASAEAVGTHNGLPAEWRFEGEQPPLGPPGADPAWGDEFFAYPPNWR